MSERPDEAPYRTGPPAAASAEGVTPDMPPGWVPDTVRALRAHLGLSQQGFADRIGTRQQTISEWETGARAPRRMSRQLLRLVAEESGFYRTANDDGPNASPLDAVDVPRETDAAGVPDAPSEPQA